MHGTPAPDPGPPAPGVDTTVPHSARVYDWWLGGKDNYAVDREMGRAFVDAIPTVRFMARQNRDFMHRAVRHLVREAGIRQFLDIGTGIPTSPNLHEVAQAVAPESRVVYVDNDPVVLLHARALMISAPQGRSAYIQADLTDPAGLLDDPVLTATLDLDRPVALTLVAILMLLDDEDDPWGKVRGLLDALPSGSHVVISHPGPEFDPGAIGRVTAHAREAGMTLVPRTRTDVARFFADWEWVAPGIVPVMAWHPEARRPIDPEAAYYWAGVARKP
ncbi:SAM-dependent methyltransferase [Nocardiopsis mangrovi]|uniref:SAM-dependent methyltransferase n=1 Tax=Nocardiopsis mangrovi TaxID=1179818 RepID=A0ABV9DZP6_9ACTN